jgi:predicted dithiol-disulfide oxidoreductase (DUF899 family)
MMGPGQSRQCVGCSLEVDHLAGTRVHLEHHDVNEIALGRGTYNYQEVDVHPGMIDLSGDSIFVKDEDGQVYHTYSAYARGGEQFHAADCGCAAHL